MTSFLVAYTLLTILGTSVLANSDVTSTNGQNSSQDVIKILQSLSKTVEKLETKIEVQTNLLNKLEGKVEIQATKLDLLLSLLNSLQAQSEIQVPLLNDLASKLEEQATCLSNSQANSDMLALLNNSQNLSSEMQTLTTNEVVKLSNGVNNSIQSKSFVDGIIAGTDDGVVVIRLDSREQRRISTKNSKGVAFDWNTRKVYWVEPGKGIIRANLDGTAAELLVLDTSELYGLAIDPITGNLYYGRRSPKREIRVCAGSAKNCAVVASGADLIGELIYDIALNPSEGIMFWSNPEVERTVIRANMDGTNATVVISENIAGLDISDRLHAVILDNRAIATYNTNGSVQEILNVVLPADDVAVDGDTVYFSEFFTKSVYSVTQGGLLSLVANTTGRVRHIALYGGNGNKVLSRPNPCEHSPCPNVCVLNRESFTCL